MPDWFQQILDSLSAEQTAELGQWILTNDDNDVTTAMIEILDPART